MNKVDLDPLHLVSVLYFELSVRPGRLLGDLQLELSHVVRTHGINSFEARFKRNLLSFFRLNWFSLLEVISDFQPQTSENDHMLTALSLIFL